MEFFFLDLGLELFFKSVKNGLFVPVIRASAQLLGKAQQPFFQTAEIYRKPSLIIFIGFAVRWLSWSFSLFDVGILSTLVEEIY